MPYYSEERLQQLDEFLDEWLPRAEALSEKFLLKNFDNIYAKEYVRHGLLRRFDLINHSVRKIFELIPPSLDAAPSRMALMDANAFVHSVYLNIFGSIDNLAIIWCHEKGIRKRNGNPIAPGNIGLGSGDKFKNIRQSFSIGFQEYLASSDLWFEYLENYRHAIAHKIPVYIPPKCLSSDDVAEFERLENEKTEASRTGNHRHVFELFHLQAQLGTFRPFLMHSINDGARPVELHGQLAIDFMTAIEIGERMLRELS